MTSRPQNVTRSIGVAEAKRRFSELLDRVANGERVVISRRGRPAVVLVSPTAEVTEPAPLAPLGLAAVAGALAEWDEVEMVVEEIYAARGCRADRKAPSLA